MLNIKSTTLAILFTIIASSVFNRVFPICLSVVYITYLSRTANALTIKDKLNSSLISTYEKVISSHIRRYLDASKTID